MKILNNLKFWIKTHKKSIITFFTIAGFLVFTLGGVNVFGIVDKIQSNKRFNKTDQDIGVIKKQNEIILGESTRWIGDKLDVTNFDEFTKVGDIRFNKNDKTLSLGYSSNFAYFLSNKYLSEHATIRTKFIPISEASDYYIIVENVFQVIIGDGDRQAVSLKSFAGGGDWVYEQPVNRAENLPPRYYLKDEFPIGNAVITEINVNAKVIDGNKRSVKLDIRFTNEEGKVYNTLDSENITWEFVVENSPSDMARYGIGLIDPSGKHKPRIQFEYLYVEEKQQ